MKNNKYYQYILIKFIIFIQLSKQIYCNPIINIFIEIKKYKNLLIFLIYIKILLFYVTDILQ